MHPTASDVNNQDNHGNTPLHWAARSGHVMACELLLRAGARKIIMNGEGKTPREYAKTQRVAGALA